MKFSAQRSESLRFQQFHPFLDRWSRESKSSLSYRYPPHSVTTRQSLGTHFQLYTGHRSHCSNTRDRSLAIEKDRSTRSSRGRGSVDASKRISGQNLLGTDCRSLETIGGKPVIAVVKKVIKLTELSGRWTYLFFNVCNWSVNVCVNRSHVKEDQHAIGFQSFTILLWLC